jgi:RimJ/RimL family protein N-acetyltransferase
MEPGKVLNLKFTPIDEASALEILSWRYEAPYDIYNLTETKDALAYALNPKNCFYVLKDDSEGVIGFCSFGLDGQVPGGDYTPDALDIGMGIRPDLTGRGHGQRFVSQVLDFARCEFNPDRFRVTIAAFNQRAQRVWSKVGFHPIGRFTHEASGREFIVLVLNDRAAHV